MFGKLGPVEAVVLTVVGLLVYLLPSIIAFRRGSPHRWAALAVNVILGATVIGWLVALYLATRRPRPMALPS
ncbi:superinfection immunity protein [Streptomyces tsukubensis]|uniref:Superinfection immunity protein n=1 Tax=Streptomyces tsukubensis TaxID=83656 RepID=A0A1V4AE17_9ACTN|nr:superinfection immunity protein [Streptomyces tsukubensis]OON81581.1 hypothetical protein B1H18_05220 [Streptomyces tsukubensis]QFR96353.1 superinfection immunity protein [Streptomyces tsukubensis]